VEDRLGRPRPIRAAAASLSSSRMRSSSAACSAQNRRPCSAGRWQWLPLRQRIYL